MGPSTSMCEVVCVWNDPSQSNLSASLVCFPYLLPERAVYVLFLRSSVFNTLLFSRFTTHFRGPENLRNATNKNTYHIWLRALWLAEHAFIGNVCVTGGQLVYNRGGRGCR